MSTPMKAIAHIVMWRLNGADVATKKQQARMIVDAF
ncbi:MAG: hypothetical protein RJA34_858, partial [Pseudomonadota bacterium]